MEFLKHDKKILNDFPVRDVAETDADKKVAVRVTVGILLS
jgi:hypothetical protein